jgi:adenine/guanine phosphoribosyltransferase-like PRPP-binding protein
VCGRAIAVIDDVLTTGSTASALTHAMLQAVRGVSTSGVSRSPAARGRRAPPGQRLHCQPPP